VDRLAVGPRTARNPPRKRWFRQVGPCADRFHTIGFARAATRARTIREHKERTMSTIRQTSARTPRRSPAGGQRPSKVELDAAAWTSRLRRQVGALLNDFAQEAQVNAEHEAGTRAEFVEGVTRSVGEIRAEVSELLESLAAERQRSSASDAKARRKAVGDIVKWTDSLRASAAKLMQRIAGERAKSARGDARTRRNFLEDLQDRVADLLGNISQTRAELAEQDSEVRRDQIDQIAQWATDLRDAVATMSNRLRQERMETVRADAQSRREQVQAVRESVQTMLANFSAARSGATPIQRTPTPAAARERAALRSSPAGRTPARVTGATSPGTGASTDANNPAMTVQRLAFRREGLPAKATPTPPGLVTAKRKSRSR
jgi:hypothetical protein